MEFIRTVFELYVDRFDFFRELFFQHLVLTAIAVAIITIVGISAGVFMSYNRAFANAMLTITGFLYTVPSIAMFGFLVTLTGIGNTSAVIALSVYGTLPLVRNTYVGIKEVDPFIIEAATGMGSTERQLLLRIKLPLALPVIMAGFRTMVIMTIALGGIASFIGAGGLGVAIWRGITTNYRELTIAGSLLVALLAVIIDQILNIAEKTIKKHVYGKVEKELL
ncbi:MAG: ABC transporter permease [Acholeplasmataceae bacterium]